MTQTLGWVSSLVLLLTIVEQLRTQIRERSQRGVSKWLFIGQTLASTGFTVYSGLLKNWVFVVTNAALLMAGVAGVMITYLHKGASQATPLPRESRVSTAVRPIERRL